MFFCKHKNEIKYAVVVAYQPLSTCNLKNRPLVVPGGLHFGCDICADEIILFWENHNKGRMELYLIQKISVNVQAETKKDYSKRVLPQIISQFKNIPPYNWYISKTDINNALKNNFNK